MQQDLIDLIKLLGNLPNTALYAMGLFIVYKIVIYLSTTGAIIYLGEKFIRVLGDALMKPKAVLKEESWGWCHALVVDRNTQKEGWVYNRKSLEELYREGLVKHFYTTTDRIEGY